MSLKDLNNTLDEVTGKPESTTDKDSGDALDKNCFYCCFDQQSIWLPMEIFFMVFYISAVNAFFFLCNSYKKISCSHTSNCEATVEPPSLPQKSECKIDQSQEYQSHIGWILGIKEEPQAEQVFRKGKKVSIFISYVQKTCVFLSVQ